jgi:hypothetical protein
VKDHDLNASTLACRRQGLLRLVDAPLGRQDATILVAVAVANHDLLDASTATMDQGANRHGMLDESMQDLR